MRDDGLSRTTPMLRPRVSLALAGGGLALLGVLAWHRFSDVVSVAAVRSCVEAHGLFGPVWFGAGLCPGHPCSLFLAPL